MVSQSAPALGILSLERGLAPGEAPAAPRPGSVLNPATFDFPIIIETVPGAWADRVLQGDRSLESSYIAAAQRLVERGAAAITSGCGFAAWYQSAVASSVHVPVALSSLLLVPAVLRQLPAATKLAVVTADATNCSYDLLGIGDPAERARIVIAGVEGGKFMQNEMLRPPPPTAVADIRAEFVTCIQKLCDGHPDVAAIVFECTAYPVIKSAIRRVTKLPIYDIGTLCRTTMASIS